MKKHSLIFHPFTIFIFSLLGPCLALFAFIHWYAQIFSNINDFQKINSDLSPLLTWNPTIVITIAVGTLGFTILGLTLIFKYFHNIQQLYQLQETFLNSFTHELKTPLASIKLYLETFLRHDLTKEEQGEFLGFMLGDVKRLSNNVQQILQIGRLENKKYKYHKDLTNLEKFIDDFIKDNQSFFESEQGGKIEFENDCPFPISYPINTALFEILLMNLISNAFKYNGGVDPKVKISLYYNKKKIILSITDNGVGLDKKNFKNIFHKFYQVNNNDQGPIKGTGLGLYITKQVASIHQGSIRVSSEGLGKGCCFTMTFPFNKKLSLPQPIM